MPVPYAPLRCLMFRLDPETAHGLGLRSLRTLHQCGLSLLLAEPRVIDPVRVLGLNFPNRVGLAAGLDKDGEAIDALAALGFGFIEVGTVTPRPQSGNPRPRLFRLPAARALINRMGFNNLGVETFLRNVRRSRREIPLGLNIGKNASTPIESALDDYVACLRAVHEHADYVTINVSSPNTPGLRRLQNEQELTDLLRGLAEERDRLAQQQSRRAPMLLKIAPDLHPEALLALADALPRHGIDGVIATNTTLSREGVEGLAHAEQAGGLSGAPLHERANRTTARLRERLGPGFPIVGVGGILDARDALDKVRCGADLVQLYSGLIYRGPRLVRDCAQALAGAR